MMQLALPDRHKGLHERGLINMEQKPSAPRCSMDCVGCDMRKTTDKHMLRESSLWVPITFNSTDKILGLTKTTGCVCFSIPSLQYVRKFRGFPFITGDNSK